MSNSSAARRRGSDDLPAVRLNLISHHARQLVRGGSGFVAADRPDLEQELTLDLLRRLPRYDASRSAPATFADRVVKHHASTLRESKRAACRDHRLEAGSVEDLYAGLDAKDVGDSLTFNEQQYFREAVEADRVADENRALRIDVRRVVASLSVDLQVICHRLATGTVTDAARDEGIDRSTIYSRIERIRAAFDRKGLADYLDD